MKFQCLENTNNSIVDVVVTTVPWTDTVMPLMAPAALKPVIQQAGLSCLAVDLNGEFLHLTKTYEHQKELMKFFFDGNATDLVVDWLEDFFKSTSQQILSYQPKWVFLSLFSYVSRSACEWFCYYLKRANPSIKIVIGGAGALENFTGPGWFAEDLLARNLADYHIRGDGEITVYELLTGNVDYPGINSQFWLQLSPEQLENLAYPDYDDYNFEKYEKQMVGILGSRGCVRSCTFCDYIENWTKFQWRSADNIVVEMFEQYKKYKIRNFKFQDSLTNGNLKEFNKMIKLLAQHNLQNPSESFKWGGFYIFREQSSNDDEMWQTMKQSGADSLIVGVENLNEDIRYAIGKKFSNKSIDYHLAQAKKLKIRLLLLFIVGYVSETQKHIDFAKQWLRDHVEYKDMITISWGGGLGIFPNTYLDRNKKELGITMIGNSPNLWVNEHTGNTPKQRAQWAIELVDLSTSLGYTVSVDLDNHFILEKMINNES